MCAEKNPENEEEINFYKIVGRISSLLDLQSILDFFSQSILDFIYNPLPTVYTIPFLSLTLFTIDFDHIYIFFFQFYLQTPLDLQSYLNHFPT